MGEETLADKLRPYVGDIVSAAGNGDAAARQIISLYRMHCACPSDPGAPALCEASFNDWLAARKAEAV